MAGFFCQAIRSVADQRLIQDQVVKCESKRLDCVGLQAFLALDDSEADLLSFFQAFEALALDGAEMHEYILAIFAADEAKALGVVEPLHGTVFAICHFD